MGLSCTILWVIMPGKWSDKRFETDCHVVRRERGGEKKETSGEEADWVRWLGCQLRVEALL